MPASITCRGFGAASRVGSHLQCRPSITPKAGYAPIVSATRHDRFNRRVFSSSSSSSSSHTVLRAKGTLPASLNYTYGTHTAFSPATSRYRDKQVDFVLTLTGRRLYQNIAPKPEESDVVKPEQLSPPPLPPSISATAKLADRAKAPTDIPTQAEQRRIDWTIVKRLMVNVWPKNDWKTRLTVLGGFGLLVSAKVCTEHLLSVPLSISRYAHIPLFRFIHSSLFFRRV
jgi:hypothetical protein